MGWFTGATAAANARIADGGRWRAIRTLTGGGTHTRVAPGGPAVVQFASNDYLGLATHPTVTDAAARAAVELGAGSGASRLIVGGREVHEALEAEIAAWKGPGIGPDAAALLFPTGFAANLGALTSVVAAGGHHDTVVLSDELNHASIIDGVRLSRAELCVFPHRDLDALEAMLAGRTRPHAVVVTDQVFSMDGDEAALGSLLGLCARHDALLVLDVAHDVFDSAGPALAAVAGTVTAPDVLVVGTLSKAVGALGGYVAGPRPAIDLLVNTARSFIFTTAPTPADCAAALAAVRLIRSPEGAERAARLRANIEHLRPGHPSPIVPVMLGDEARALEVSAALLERGLLVPAIRPPTVPEGTCRLRVALSAEHTDVDLDRLVTALDALGVTLDD